MDRLVARWEKPLFAFAWRYVRNTADARNLTAEIFVRLYQQRARLRPDTNLAAWLFTSLANLCHNHHRWRQRHAALSLDATGAGENGRTIADEISAAAPAPSEIVEQQEELDALAAAIDRMPHELKTALLLHHFEQLTYREIGEISRCSERGVETRLYRARQYLRSALAGFHHEPIER